MQNGVEVRDGVALLQMGDTLLALWQAPMAHERWLHHLNRMKTMAVSRAAGIVCLTLVMAESTPPDAALRQQMQAGLRGMSSTLRRVVVVPLGDSLWLSIVRTIARGLLLLSGQSQRQRVTATVREGLEEVRAAAGPETPSIAELEKGVAALFSALGTDLPRAA